MPCWRAKKWTYAKACYRMESDKEEPCMKIVNTEEFNALMNEDAVEKYKMMQQDILDEEYENRRFYKLYLNQFEDWDDLASLEC